MNLYEPSAIKDIRLRHGFKFSKSLGQNFLTDKNIIDRIIEGAGVGSDDTVIEIGPGIGVITGEAAKRAKRVIAVEIDKSLIPILEETLGEFNNVTVINEDVLKVDISALTAGENPDNIKIMGNLPYYITTPIIMKLLEEQVKADSITIMMQKEVADRIKAGPGSKAYGALSVAVQYYCNVEKVADVPRGVFVPQPNVDSTVLKLKLKKEKTVKPLDEKVFFDCVKAAFSQRRKTLLNSMQTLQGASKELIRNVLEDSGIEPNRRAETLTVEEFVKIADEVDKRL